MTGCMDLVPLDRWGRVPSCPECGCRGNRDEKHDAYFCPDCVVWIESICDDTTCSYCATRPETPDGD